MKKGLVILKAEPLTLGHEKLIQFAKNHCDFVYVLLCTNNDEEVIPGNIRINWLYEKYNSDHKIILKHTDKKLPYTSESDRYVSLLWSKHIKTILPDINVIISSEKYGDYVAEYLNIKHILYDKNRSITPISGTMIRNQPFKYWNYISDVAKSHFIKKVCICGTESTGKTILTENLARHFNTNFVPEWGRYVVNNSNDVTEQNLIDIGRIHAKDILKKILKSNKILFSDTDLNTTKMYYQYFFKKTPEYEKWIEDANNFDLYIFLDKDAPYIQDGTRLDKNKRNDLSDYHYNYLKNKQVNLSIISGDTWDLRTEKAIKIIENNFFNY